MADTKSRGRVLLEKVCKIFKRIIQLLKEHWSDYLVLLLIAAIVIGLDQWTKALVREYVSENGSWMPWDWLKPYARVLHTYNSGAAFGLFKRANLLFSILAVNVAEFILYFFPHIPPKERLLRLALGLQFGGAIGNLIDRLAFGQVTDFISVGNFAVWNVADACITVGVALLILIALPIHEPTPSPDEKKEISTRIRFRSQVISWFTYIKGIPARIKDYYLQNRESIVQDVRTYAPLLLVAGAIVGLDQWSKTFLRVELPFDVSWSSWIGLLFTILEVNIAELIVYFYARIPPRQRLLQSAMAFLLGGAVGNLVDYLVTGQAANSVIVGMHPVFDIADFCIVIGVVMFIIWASGKQPMAKPGETKESRDEAKGE